MTGIYKITNITNEKCYIGKAKDIELRWKQHLKDLRNNEHDNEHLQSSFNICGESTFIFEVVIECDESMLNYYERELIEEFEARDNRFGYNMRTGEIFGSKALCGERIGCSAQAINKAMKNNKKCKGFTIVLYNV